MAKGIVKLNQDKCKACELCVSVCPKGCLGLETEAVNVKGYHPVAFLNPDDCIGCGRCAIMCPDAVINVYKED